MPIIRIFGIVTAGALVGMVLGGVFGQWAGANAPEFFEKAAGGGKPAADPVGTARFLGAAGGVLLGGGLAVFALMLSAFHEWLRARPARE